MDRRAQAALTGGLAAFGVPRPSAPSPPAPALCHLGVVSLRLPSAVEARQLARRASTFDDDLERHVLPGFDRLSAQSGPMRGRAWMIVVAEMSWRTSISEPGITMPGEGSTVRSFAPVA